MDSVTREPREEPQAVFGQPELPFDDLERLDSIQRVQLWLESSTLSEDHPNVIAARLVLRDSETRLARAARWARVMEIEDRCMHEWGILLHGGPETVWLLQEAGAGLVEGHWIASLLCSHAACERHLAGLLMFREDSLPKSWGTWGLGRLLEAAEELEVLPQDLVAPLFMLNETRKVSAHFKPPFEAGSLTSRAHRAAADDKLAATQQLAEADAFRAYETARSFVYRAHI